VTSSNADIELYAVVATREKALDLVQQIDAIKKFSSTWDVPREHPLKEECLILLDWQQLQGCEQLLSGCEQISGSEARRRGWYLRGRFSGAFAVEQEKLEDVHLLFDAAREAYGKPNFPAFRALLLSFLSACYALRENLHDKCMSSRFSPVLEAWWQSCQKEMSDRNGLLFAFEQYMNAEKHGGKQVAKLGIKPVASLNSLLVDKCPPNADPSTCIISAEGCHVKVDVGTYLERWVPVGLHEATYGAVVENAPLRHLGVPLSSHELTDLLPLIRSYYAELVHGAIQRSKSAH
jgi:hypothetical protein